MTERFTINTISAVGSYQILGRDKINAQQTGLHLQLKCNSNYRAQLLMSLYDDGVMGNFVDITSMFTGGANITNQAGAWFLNSFAPHKLYLNVDSLAGGALLVACG
jgi:hypothetical protein